MNTTTLNMTTLDGGNVIIKRGEGGGGATINNQDKVVDITENGTTEVVADDGYTGLGKVTINTEVSGGESGGSNWRYFDFRNMTTTGVQSYATKSLLAMIGKFDLDGAKFIATPTTLIIEGGKEFMANCVAGGIETSAKCSKEIGEAELIDWNSYLDAIGLSDSRLADMGITEITKEEFYNLD